ncbi:NADH-quinone oxidoreductase subunit J [Candidatus Berkiella aquae]|uniref:NADH-quinone oxidoreductase subunit J n=1 Tax=Candidatus Berkiella aquae TaxID=295108 RepID=A0A0Q9YYN5_9GAMM|nr:NADH-quinone oxidoreductase subunit J [Candidatus Berkiella aquae]MCS5710500.1 NADH-quinone oxidoreductase subunit J [Candidatus Berkiella aquae]
MTITIQQLVFLAFSVMAIVSAIMVVASKNPVKAVLFLVFTFFCTAGLWMLLESEFLSIVLVLVYVGAVMVLFLFVVMMLDVETDNKQPFVKHWPIGLLIAAIMIGVMSMVVGAQHFGLEQIPMPEAFAKDYSHVKALASLLYSNYLLPFEIAGIILLVAMIAAIGLTFRGPRDSKTQKVNLQTQVTKQQRLTIVKMPVVKGEPQA